MNEKNTDSKLACNDGVMDFHQNFSKLLWGAENKRMMLGAKEFKIPSCIIRESILPFIKLLISYYCISCYYKLAA